MAENAICKEEHYCPVAFLTMLVNQSSCYSVYKNIFLLIFFGLITFFLPILPEQWRMSHVLWVRKCPCPSCTCCSFAEVPVKSVILPHVLRQFLNLEMLT